MKKVEFLNPLEQGLLEIISRAHPCIHTLADDMIQYVESLSQEYQSELFTKVIEWYPANTLATEETQHVYDHNTRERQGSQLFESCIQNLQMSQVMDSGAGIREAGIALITDFQFLASQSTDKDELRFAKATMLAATCLYYESPKATKTLSRDEVSRRLKGHFNLMLQNPSATADAFRAIQDPSAILDPAFFERVAKDDPQFIYALIVVLAKQLSSQTAKVEKLEELEKALDGMGIHVIM